MRFTILSKKYFVIFLLFFLTPVYIWGAWDDDCQLSSKERWFVESFEFDKNTIPEGISLIEDGYYSLIVNDSSVPLFSFIETQRYMRPGEILETELPKGYFPTEKLVFGKIFENKQISATYPHSYGWVENLKKVDSYEFFELERATLGPNKKTNNRPLFVEVPEPTDFSRDFFYNGNFIRVSGVIIYEMNSDYIYGYVSPCESSGRALFGTPPPPVPEKIFRDKVEIFVQVFLAKKKLRSRGLNNKEIESRLEKELIQIYEEEENRLLIITFFIFILVAFIFISQKGRRT